MACYITVAVAAVVLVLVLVLDLVDSSFGLDMQRAEQLPSATALADIAVQLSKRCITCSGSAWLLQM